MHAFGLWKKANSNNQGFSSICVDKGERKSISFQKSGLDERIHKGDDTVYFTTGQWGYAGWNTNGNTLGTIIANGFLLHLNLCKDYILANSIKEISLPLTTRVDEENDAQLMSYRFTLMRIMEDFYYQSIIRQELIQYVQEQGGDITQLTQNKTTAPLYQSFTYKRLSDSLKAIENKIPFYSTTKRNFREQYKVTKEDDESKRIPSLEYSLLNSSFPWNRTFEIGYDFKYIA